MTCPVCKGTSGPSHECPPRWLAVNKTRLDALALADAIDEGVARYVYAETPSAAAVEYGYQVGDDGVDAHDIVVVVFTPSAERVGRYRLAMSLAARPVDERGIAKRSHDPFPSAHFGAKS